MTSTKISAALAQAAEDEPELAPLYLLYSRLWQLHEQTQESITATLEMADEEALENRIKQGMPLLSFAQLPLEPASFAALAGEIAQTIRDFDVEVSDLTLPDGPAEWFALAEQRFEEMQAVEGLPPVPEEGLSLAQRATDLALRPYLAWAAERIMPHVEQDWWKRGYCPVCGGAPDFAVLDNDTGARHLLCSRCDTQWLYKRIGCPYCGTDDHTKIVYYPSDDEVYRLYVCQECQHYLKAIDLRKAGREDVSLPLERIFTVAMDMAAQSQGFRAP